MLLEDSRNNLEHLRSDQDVSPESVVLVTTVEIAPNYSKTITLRRGDNPLEVASTFCRSFCLSEDVAKPLAQHLQDNMEKAMECQNETRGDRPGKSLAPSCPEELSGEEDAPDSSRHISRCYNNADQTVFDRLYLLAERRRLQQESQQKQAQGQHPAHQGKSRKGTKLPGEFANYGEYLYIEGLASMEQKKQNSIAASQEQAEREVHGATFKPDITKSQRLHPNGSVWQRLSRTAPSSSATRKVEMYKAESEKELVECTFKPKINKKSSSMVQHSTSHQMSAYEKLYHDAQIREDKLKNKKQELLNETSHQAQSGLFLSHSRQPSTNYSSFDSSMASCMPAGDRLYAYHLKKEAKLSRARQAQLFDVDGNPLFRPATGRAPVSEKAGPKTPRWEALYSQRNSAESKRRELERLQVLEEQRARSSALRVSAKSEELLAGPHMTVMLNAGRGLFCPNPSSSNECSFIIQDRTRRILHVYRLVAATHLYRRRFEQIFKYLDSDVCGTLDLIDVQQTDRFGSLSQEVWQDVEGAAILLCVTRKLCDGPVTEAVLGDKGARHERLVFARAMLAEKDLVGEGVTTVNLHEFIALMSEVVAICKLHTRTYLLPDIRVQPDEVPTFHPAINGKSVAMTQSRLNDRNRTVHESLHEHAKIVQVRKDMRQRIHELEELSQCTFHPDLGSPINRSRSCPSKPDATEKRISLTDLLDWNVGQAVDSGLVEGDESLYQLAALDLCP